MDGIYVGQECSHVILYWKKFIPIYKILDKMCQ